MDYETKITYEQFELVLYEKNDIMLMEVSIITDEIRIPGKAKLPETGTKDSVKNLSHEIVNIEDVITKDNFSKLVELHYAIKFGENKKVEKISRELGLKHETKDDDVSLK